MYQSPSLNPTQFQQLRRLFWQWFEVPVAGRAVLLATLARTVDAEVFTHLCQLLEAHAAAGDFLAEPCGRGRGGRTAGAASACRCHANLPATLAASASGKSELSRPPLIEL